MQQQNEKINEKSNCTRTSQGSSQNEREAWNDFYSHSGAY
jgi:hypothetical protein